MIRCLAFLLLFTPAFADHKNDFDPDAPFATFKTYSFIGIGELEKSGFIATPENRERLRNFVSGELDQRNLREVPQDEKYDLAVRLWVARRQKTEEINIVYTDPYYQWLSGYPPYWSGPWGPYYDEWVVRQFVEGTLIIDLINPSTKQLVWRTYLRRKLDPKASGKYYEDWKKELHKSLAKFPPANWECENKRKERNRLGM